MTSGEFYYWGVIFNVTNGWTDGQNDTELFNHKGEAGDSSQTITWNWTIIFPTAAAANAPSITNALANGTNNFTFGEFIKINATVTDANGNLNNVTIQYLPPGGTAYNITAPHRSGDEFYNDTINLSQAGQWEFIFFANDTTGLNATSVVVQELNGEVLINVSTQVTNTAPTIDPNNITLPGTQTITEDSFINVSFDFIATDLDGADDLDNTTAQGYINITNGISTRSNFTCESIQNVNTTTNRYNCTVHIWYFDTDGDWTINVSIQDTSSEYVEDTSQVFTLASTRGMKMSPTAISWASITLGDTNKLADDDPITINNTANANISVINVTGYNLHGSDFTAQFIYAANFSSNVSDSCNTNAFLGNATNATIITASASPGNHTPDDGTAQEELFFCLEAIEPPGGSLLPQTYDTTNSFEWEIKVA